MVGLLILFHRCLSLCSFFKNNFSLCCSDWNIFIDFSSSTLSLNSIFILLLSLSSEFQIFSYWICIWFLCIFYFFCCVFYCFSRCFKSSSILWFPGVLLFGPLARELGLYFPSSATHFNDWAHVWPSSRNIQRE